MSVLCNHALAGLIARIAVRNSKCKRQRSWICWGFRRSNSSCVDPTALIVGHRRRRPRCPEHMPFLFCYFPAWWCGGNFLKGGGPKKSQSGKQVTEVAQCLKQLTQADGAVQAQLSGHDVPTETITKVPRRKRRKPKPLSKPGTQPTLWDTLESLPVKTKASGQKPSDDAVRIVLQSPHWAKRGQRLK